MENFDERGIVINYDTKEISVIDMQTEKKETYSLAVMPDKNSSLVKKLKDDITQELQIKNIVGNMSNSAGLMFVAYNALSGTVIQAKMSGLQKNLLDLCDESLVSITSFRQNSEKISNYIMKAYDYLLKSKETTALKQFERCSACAKKMAESAEKLAEGFSDISDKTEKVLEDSQTEEALQYENMKELENQLIEYNTKIAENKKILEEQLNIEINEANKRYEEAKKKEEKDEKRKLAFEIVQVVGSFVGGLVDIFTPDINGLMNLNDNSNSTSKIQYEKMKEELNKVNAQLSEANRELNANTEKQNELNTKKIELEKEIENLNNQLKEAQSKNDSNAIASLTNSISSSQINLASCTNEIGLVIEATKACQIKMEALKNQIASINLQIEKLANSAQNDIDRDNSEKLSALDKKLELEKQRRDMLQNIADWTAIIEKSSEAKNTASTAVETLHVAIKCLKEIVTSLQTAALFWRSMESYCESLSEAEILEIIEDTEDDDEDEKLTYYMSEEFMTVMLNYLAQWSALYYVCDEYIAATREVRGDVVENINAAPSIEEGLAMAPVLAEEMNENIKKQIDESTSLINNIEEVVINK